MGLSPLVVCPIVAGIGYLNENMGLWIDCQLQSLVKQLPSYLRRTKQLCNQIDWVKGDLWILRVMCPVCTRRYPIH